MSKVIKYSIFETSWGYFGLAGIEKGLLRTQLPTIDCEKLKSRLLNNVLYSRYDKDFCKSLQLQIKAYFDDGYVDFSREIPVILDGFSEFTREVLTICREIRFGETRSYSQLADLTGRHGSVRAVGGALARNRLPLIIPCHRVIYANGKVGGFSASGGVELKARLLRYEQELRR